jgi:hypothetical protein
MCQPGQFPYLVFVKEFRAFTGDGHGLPEQLIVLAGEAIEFGRLHKINPSARWSISEMESQDHGKVWS